MEVHQCICEVNHTHQIQNTLRDKAFGWHRFAFHLLLCKHFSLYLCNPRCFHTRSNLCTCSRCHWTGLLSSLHVLLPCRSSHLLQPPCKSLLYQGVHSPCYMSRSLRRKIILIVNNVKILSGHLLRWQGHILPKILFRWYDIRTYQSGLSTILSPLKYPGNKGSPAIKKNSSHHSTRPVDFWFPDERENTKGSGIWSTCR